MSPPTLIYVTKNRVYKTNLMPNTGLEPVPQLREQILSLPRIPISPTKQET